jgi:hypothetical protein
MNYYLGVDFGSQQDYTALALVKRNDIIKKEYSMVQGFTEEDVCTEYQLLFIERMDLGTPYQKVVDRVNMILRDEDLRGDTVVVPDATGVGIPIVQLMRSQGVSPMIPISIHGGQATNKNDFGGYSVPKRDLVSSLAIVVQSRRLRVASDINYRMQLVHEMQNFVPKFTKNGGDTYEALMEKDHDDLVMALAMAVWLAEKHGRPVLPTPPQVKKDIMA